MAILISESRLVCLFGAAALATTVALAQAQAPVAAPAAPATAVSPATTLNASVDTLPWMVGCWQARSMRNGAIMNETWFAPHGGTLMGIGQSYRDTNGISWEAMRMYDDGDSIKMWLRPAQRNELTLSLESVGPNFAGFVGNEGNKVTRLRYERKGETELVATFRMEQGESRQGADFAFSKVECSRMFSSSNEATPANRP